MSLELRNVGRTFNGRTAVRNVSFTAHHGEIIGLLGTSGCGKSTVLRAISGLDDAYDGQIVFNGKEYSDVHSAIGFIFQEPRLMPWLTVLENVTFGLKGTKAEREAKGRVFLENVGLGGSENAYPKELSGGMAQRAAIARALVASPEVLLLDEPFSALDAFTKMQLQDLLLDIWKTYQTTIVLVTHDIDEATYLCDRIITLRGQPGEVEKEITIEEARPRTRGSAALGEYKKEILGSLDLNQPAAAKQ